MTADSWIDTNVLVGYKPVRLNLSSIACYSNKNYDTMICDIKILLCHFWG